MSDFILLAYEFSIPAIPFLFTLLLFSRKHKKEPHVFPSKYLGMLLVFAFYIMAVFHFTGSGTLYDLLRYQLEINSKQLNFIPFSKHIDLTGYLLNLILFFPFGCLVPFIWEKQAGLFRILSAGFLFSLLIEVSQLLNNRSTDIDDLILNTLGAVLGFIAYKIISKFTSDHFQLHGIPVTEYFIYVAILFLGRFFLFNEMGAVRLLYGF